MWNLNENRAFLVSSLLNALRLWVWKQIKDRVHVNPWNSTQVRVLGKHSVKSSLPNHSLLVYTVCPDSCNQLSVYQIRRSGTQNGGLRSPEQTPFGLSIAGWHLDSPPTEWHPLTSNSKFWAIGQGSVDKALATQAWRPKFKSPALCQKFGMKICTCNLSTGTQGQGGVGQRQEDS